jgi:hypothetical protein
MNAKYEDKPLIPRPYTSATDTETTQEVSSTGCMVCHMSHLCVCGVCGA